MVLSPSLKEIIESGLKEKIAPSGDIDFKYYRNKR
jgi:hypothetical protein